MVVFMVVVLGGKNNKGSTISSNIYGNATINIDENTIIDNNVYWWW